MNIPRIIQVLLLSVLLTGAWFLWHSRKAQEPETTLDAGLNAKPAEHLLPGPTDLPPVLGAAAEGPRDLVPAQDATTNDAARMPEFTRQSRSPINLGDPSITPETDPAGYMSIQPTRDVGERLPDPLTDQFVETGTPVRNIGPADLVADPDA